MPSSTSPTQPTRRARTRRRRVLSPRLSTGPPSQLSSAPALPLTSPQHWPSLSPRLSTGPPSHLASAPALPLTSPQHWPYAPPELNSPHVHLTYTVSYTHLTLPTILLV
eukprot:5083470-Pleurochrysis_carterae.AAC.1